MLLRPKDQIKGKVHVDRQTIMTMRMLAKKGTDRQIEDYFERVCVYYLSNMTGDEFMQHDEFIRLKGKEEFETTCPYCGETMVLDLKALAAENEDLEKGNDEQGRMDRDV